MKESLSPWVKTKHVLWKILFLFLVYSFLGNQWQHIYDAGEADGYEWGYEMGVIEGSNLACMVKPI